MKQYTKTKNAESLCLNGFMHRFVPGKNSQAPTLLLLHGMGGSENDLLRVGSMLLPDAAQLSPRGRILENGTEARFFRRLSKGVFDEADLRYRTDELANFVLTASREYDFDPAHVIVIGFSNGANIAASLLLWRPELLAAAILLRPLMPAIPNVLPDLSCKPVFMSAGRHDDIVDVTQITRLEQILRTAHADLTLDWFDCGHPISHEDIREGRDWVQRYAF